MTKREAQIKKLIDMQLEIDSAERSQEDTPHQVACLMGVVQDLKYFCETLIEENPQLLKDEDKRRT